MGPLPDFATTSTQLCHDFAMNLLKKLKNLAGVVDHAVQDLSVVADVGQLAVVVHFVQGQDLAVVALDLEKNRKIRKSSGKSSNKSLQKSNIEVMS